MHERITFRIPTQQLEALDRLVEDGIYPNRSEAIRDAVRDVTESGTQPEYQGSRDTRPERASAQSND